MIRDTAAAPENPGASADDILIGAELARRPARKPDFAAESEALHTLARLLIDRPESLPKRLAEIALELCHAGSAGVSLLEKTPQGVVFRWTALAGQLAPYEGGSTPRGFSPCGLCLDRGEAILVADPARRFDYFNAVGIPIVEGLVLPLLGAARRPLGTLWIVAHLPERQFDAEDLRVMTRLADFTALAIECG
ncbi:MAG: GAF domain-containing protein, partial [Pseudomonadota bacterium]